MTDQDNSNNESFEDLGTIRLELDLLIKLGGIGIGKNYENKNAFLKPEEQWRIALEIVMDGILDWDIRTNKVTYSKRWKEILGYDESGIEDRPEEWIERIHPNDLKSTLRGLTNHLKGETQTFNSEYRIVCKDGSYKWILSEGQVILRDNHGNPVRFVVNNRDISRQKDTDFELRERLKELSCHNRMSEIIGNTTLTADDVIREIIQTIPGSWHFPEIAQASALIYNKVFETTGYKKGELTLSQDIKVQGEVIGKVEVGYPDGLILGGDPVFLPEESQLLFSISNRLGSYLEKTEKSIALKESQSKYLNIIENINDIIFEIDNQGFITFISSPVFKVFGYTAEEIKGKNFIHFVGENGQLLLKRLNEISEKIELKNEYKIRTKTGESRWIQMSTRAIFSEGNFIGAAGTIIDITQRKITEIELQKSESLYLSVLNASPDAISIANLEGIVVYSSPRLLKMFMYHNNNEILNRSIFDFIAESDHNRAQNNIEKLFQGILLGAEEYIAIRSDGTPFYIEVNADIIRDPEGNPTSLVLVTRDISDRKLAEIELKNSEEKYRYIFDNAIEGMYRTTLDGKALMANPALATMLGYHSISEYLKEANDSALKTWYNPGRRSEYISLLEKHNFIQGFECQLKRTDGSPIWVSLSAKIVQDENGNNRYLEGFVAEISERKLAEEKIEKLNRLYSVISHVSQAIVHIRDKYDLMNEVCRIAIEYGKFTMAWIGVVDETTKIVKPIVTAGYEDGYLSIIRPISVSDVPEGRGPTGNAIRKGDHFVCSDIENDPGLGPWRKEALNRGYRSSMALPLKQSGKIFGAFSLYSAIPNFFDAEEIRLLDEFVNEISYAFEAIDTETERQKAEEQLRKLSRAVEQSPVSIVIADLEGNIEYANPKVSSTTGYSFDELVGKNPRVLKSGETPDSEYQKLWEDITAGKEWHGLFHNKRKNGEFYWESSTISPIISNEGKITHFLAVKEDITEQKLAEQELRQSEERYKVLFENDHTVMMLIDPQTGEIINVNPAACNYYGWSSSELCAKKIWEINVIDPDELKDQMQHALNHNVNQFYFKHRLRNGEIRDVEVFSNPVQIRESKLLFAIINDITKRKLAEQEILKFRTIADQANYGSAITSLEGNILYTNDAFAHLHGFESNELLGKRLDIFHNQDQLPKVEKLLNQLRETGSFSAQEVWHTRKDGSVFPTLMNALLIHNQNNVPQFFSATLIDITELHQKEEALQRSENELNRAQELAHLGSWEHNLVTGKLTGSKNYYRMLGLMPEENKDELYEYFVSRVYPDDQQVVVELQQHHYVQNEMKVADLRLVMPGGEIRWIQNNVVPIFDGDQLVGLQGVNIDVTEKKKILDDLINAKEQAEESDKLKTSFLNNISHEIRTPFNGILGFLSMLQYDGLEPVERDEYIGIINQSAERLMNTINDIVDLSQIQTGLMKVNLSSTDIQGVINDQVTRFRPEAELKGLQFNVTRDFPEPIDKFLTDRKKLNTILFHLIGNAIKFTKSGSIEVTVLGNVKSIEFCVKDTGIGISKDKQQIIFNRFMQADHSNTRKFEGSGLGLTIAKAYVDMLNGKLWMESHEGQGSSFYFSIPNGIVPDEKRTKTDPEKEKNENKELKILIAEDDEGSAVFLSILVKPFCQEVLKVRSGVEVVDACRNNPDLDLILMDIRMPIMDGYEATRQIRKFNSKVVIIAQTAFALTGDYEKAIAAGCNDYISKPIRKDKLQMLIHNFFK